MAHRQSSSGHGNPGTNQHMQQQQHSFTPHQLQQLHAQQQQQQQQHNLIHHQQQQQQSRHRSPGLSDHHPQIHAHLPPRHELSPDIGHHMDPHLRSSPGTRLNPNNHKSNPYLQSDSNSWRAPIPSHFSHPPNLHTPFLPGNSDEQVRDHRDRERAEEAKRAQEQVMKHFEESFRFAQQKSSGSVQQQQQGQGRYQPPPPPSQPQGGPKPGEDLKARGHSHQQQQQQMMSGSSKVPSPQNKGIYHHNMAYAQMGQTSPYQEHPSGMKKNIHGPPPPLTTEYLRSAEIELRAGFYPPHLAQGNLGQGMRQQPREPISNPSSEKYSNNNQTCSKPNYPTYGAPPPANRVKVSSPAPPQIYGKPNIPGSNSPSARSTYDSESSPLSLTSKGGTRPTPTPPLPLTAALPKHEIRSGEIPNYYMYSSASNAPPYNQPLPQSVQSQPRFSPKSEYQTVPLDLGGKRKIEQKHQQNVELEIKKVKNEAREFHQDQTHVLNLVKGEAEVGGGPPDIPINGDENERDKNRVSDNVKEEVRLIESPAVPVELIKREGFTTPPPSTEILPIKVEEVGAGSEGDTNAQPETPMKSGATGSNSNCSSPSLGIHKGKKVFLQRHSGQDVIGVDGPSSLKNGGCKDPSDSNTTTTSNGLQNSGSKPSTPRTKSRRKTDKSGDMISNNGYESLRKRGPSSSDSDDGIKIPVKKARGKAKGRNNTKNSETEKSGSEETESQSQSDRSEPVSGNSTPVKKRGRKPRGIESPSQQASLGAATTPSPSKGPPSKKSNPFKRPAIHLLKKSGESFLQDGPCADMAPKLGKCRECRINGAKTKKHSNIFCRFYAFRKLRYTKNGSLAIAGFSDPTSDPSQDDMNLWLPSKETRPKALELDMAKFLIDQLGDQFCELIHHEKEAREVSLSSDTEFVAWKRVVQGVREMCDVCDTTLFNYHWACKKCGFVVCIACYTARKQGIKKKTSGQGKERDDFQWLFCSSNRQGHEIEMLMLTQAVAGDALTTLGQLVHQMRVAWNISQDCGCEEAKNPTPYTKDSKLNEHSLSPVVVIPEIVTESNTQDPKPGNNGNKDEDAIALVPAEPKPQVPSVKKDDSEESRCEGDGISRLSGMLGPKNTPSASEMTPQALKDKEKEVPRPPVNDSIPKDKDEKKLLKTDELKSSPSKKELTFFIRRTDVKIHRGKDGPPVKAYLIQTTTKAYPGVPHSWLCFGKLLHLHDPLHPGNQKIFQEVWQRGQPVIVSHVSDRLNKNLWSPESFSKDFSELKNDLVNCMTGRSLSSQPMKKFWEGFEYVNKRLKDEKGNPMLLKLKDWPPGEDFAESLPSRFKDLMANLPLRDYTNRSGRLNLASRLPDNFVKPDLGPKMYIAYGSGLHLDKGTTNLHLDISDAVNLMVHVGVPKDVNNDDDIAAVQEAIEQSDVDGATIDRVKETGDLPGALWHIYNARDADKIRDLLNKVALERGVALEAHHDPIHDQSWYLDSALRQRLVEEYNVMGFPLVQFMGDAVFIPAGAPHQVRNLHNCIKIAEDFVSPENVSHCFHLTEEFRHLTETHSNHEDKLQIKNIIYHAVKDAVSVLHHSLTEETEPN